MGVIYKITNKINNKSYIGQTIQEVEKRWNAHKYNGLVEANTKFYRALQKYGIENFDWEVIEEVENSSLNEREIFWIDFYNTYHDGYNSTLGGDNPPRVDISVICLETEKVYASCREAGKDMNINACHIAECARGYPSRKTAGGFHWMQYEEYKQKGPIYKKTKNEKTSKMVICEETQVIYNSILEASKSTGVSRQAIKRSCEGVSKNPEKISLEVHIISKVQRLSLRGVGCKRTRNGDFPLLGK